MKIRELQALVDRKWPGAWCAARNKTGFVLTRADSVELVSCTELATLTVMMRDFQAYVTTEPVSEWSEDGVVLAVWFMPHKTARSHAARVARKPRHK